MECSSSAYSSAPRSSATGRRSCSGGSAATARKAPAGFFGQQGYRSPVALAVVAGLCEATGGTLLALGLATPLACALIAIVMLNAIGSVTFKRDAFMLGSELELVYFVIAVGLAALGPLRFSLDRALGWDDNISGLWWGVLVLGCAAVVSFVTMTVGRTRTATAQPAAGA